MSANSNNSTARSVLLVLLGISAIYAGPIWLAVLIPAAALIWYSARPAVRTGRN